MNTVAAKSIPATILIADDDPVVRSLLRIVLQNDGYACEECEDGQQVLDRLQEIRPDLIVLDAMMPVLDGFEVCAALQMLPYNERIPVLIITGLEDERSVDRAFQVGAADFVTKPVHWPVLRNRVRRILSMRQMENARDELTQMIVHDMKTPIANIRGFAELLLGEHEDNPSLTDLLNRIYRNSNNLLDLTMMILDIGRLEEGQLFPEITEGNICAVFETVYNNHIWMATQFGVSLEIECDTTLRFSLDWSLIQRVLANLVTNAIKHNRAGGKVYMSAEQNGNRLVMAVRDEGEGISEQDQKRIFEKYKRADKARKGSALDTGLGLTFCKLATEIHGGQISVASALGEGATFILEFDQAKVWESVVSTANRAAS